MQKMAASMGGGMPPGAAEQMKNMTAEDMKRASEEMANMTPDQLKSQMNAAMNQSRAQADYALRGAEQLKKDGNKLVGEGKYKEAIEKYMRVKNNLADDASPGAVALRTSCMLNMSLCFNKTNRHNSAISECTEVLKSDGRALKAYYRRGQAHFAKNDLKLAVADLRRAANLAPEDETVAAERDKAVRDLVASGEEDDGECPPFENGGANDAVTRQNGGAPGAPEMMNPDMMAKAAEAMKDPNFMSKASEMMENMTEEQLEQMSAMAPGGMPKVDPKMAKQAAAMMKNMKPEAMEGMMKMAQTMKDAGLDPASGGLGAGGGAPSADQMAKMQEAMKDPAMQEAMSDMMKNISPEQLKEMGAASGMRMTDEQAEQTAKMMQSISPATMRRMMAAGTALQGAYARFVAVRAWVGRNKLLAGAIAVAGVSVAASYLMRWGWFAPKTVDAAEYAAGEAGEEEAEDEAEGF